MILGLIGLFYKWLQILFCLSFTDNISQKQQSNTYQYTGGVNQHILEGRATIRYKTLNGFVHTGHQKAAGQCKQQRFGKHSVKPGEQCAQAGKFRKVSQLSQKTVSGIRVRRTTGKQKGQDIAHPMADCTGDRTGQTGITPNEQNIDSYEGYA